MPLSWRLRGLVLAEAVLDLVVEGQLVRRTPSHPVAWPGSRSSTVRRRSSRVLPTVGALRRARRPSAKRHDPACRASGWTSRRPCGCRRRRWCGRSPPAPRTPGCRPSGRGQRGEEVVRAWRRARARIAAADLRGHLGGGWTSRRRARPASGAVERDGLGLGGASGLGSGAAAWEPSVVMRPGASSSANPPLHAGSAHEVPGSGSGDATDRPVRLAGRRGTTASATGRSGRWRGRRRPRRVPRVPPSGEADRRRPPPRGRGADEPDGAGRYVGARPVIRPSRGPRPSWAPT